MTQTQIFEPEGRAIPYTQEGSGPGLVLIPGLGLGAAYLGALAHALSEAGHQVVRIGSRRPGPDVASAPSMHDLAQDVVDVMDHLGLEDAWVGGHAFGGLVARTVSRDHHDRVNGVLLLGVETAVEEEDAWAPDSEDAQILATARDTGVESMQRAALASSDVDSAEPAPGIPVLVVQGAADRITPVSNGEALQAAAPDRVSVASVDGGGHLFPATHAVATSWAIEDYLDWD